MAVTVLDGEASIRAAVGTHLGYSDWLMITQDSLELFASATGDSDATYLVLSVSNLFLPQIVEVHGFAMGINYGTNAVRFPVPLHPPQRLRGGATLDAVTAVAGGLQTEMTIEISTEDGDTVCSIESLSRWLT